MSASEIVKLGPLAGGAGAGTVELVEVDGRRLVLKRAAPARAAGERRFQAAMAAAGLPSLEVVAHPALGDGELLLEFVEGSPTVGRSAASAALLRRWGAAVAGLHGVATPGFERVDSAGEVVAGEWPRFVELLIGRAMGAQQGRGHLPDALLGEAGARLGELRGFAPRRFALAHGDLHANNVLVRGDDIVLFDKASRVWSCPPVFDVALIYATVFPGARYGVAREGDGARMDAFMAGYGALPADEARWLDHFALAHCLQRYPNPFTRDLREVIDAVLARLRR